MFEMDIIILLLLILLKIFLFGLIFYVLIINFQLCQDEANVSLVLNQFTGCLLEARSSTQHVYIAALIFHPLSSGFMVYHRTTVSNILGWFPSFFVSFFFLFLEQELSFHYDSSSSFLTLKMKCISYFIYVQFICISFSPLFL